MIELVIIACLAAQPTRCEAHSVYIETHQTVVCLAVAMPVIVGWAHEHPLWRPKRWRCRPLGA